jgi:hypothetical protein
VNGACEFLGLKVKPLEESTSLGFLVFIEDNTQDSWDDLMTAEPCIYLLADCVYVVTR